jgi:N-acetylglucosaminyl-diphospho-decaprenol L-rhamnosyltransferase
LAVAIRQPKAKIGPMPPISVVIVSYRTPQLTASAAASVLRLPDVSEVIVIDNASGDETGDLLHALQDDRVQFVVNQSNAGYGQAANLAASMATTDLLLFLNSDAEIDAGAANVLVSEVLRHGGRCIAAARLVGEDGGVQRSAGLLPGPTDLTVRALGLHRLGRAVMRWPLVGRLARGNRLAREYDLALGSTEPISTTMVSGAVCAMGRDAFNEIGGFDQRFFLYFEDADLCRRALRTGMQIRYMPAAVVRHIGGASSTEDYHFSPRHARAMRQYLGKWYGPPGAALAVVLMFLRAVGITVGSPRGAGRAWRAVGATLGFGGGA